jgi:hypothetical protein
VFVAENGTKSFRGWVCFVEIIGPSTVMHSPSEHVVLWLLTVRRRFEPSKFVESAVLVVNAWNISTRKYQFNIIRVTTAVGAFAKRMPHHS